MPPADNTAMRAPRFESHALVDIKLHWWNPFSTQSAVLLDISWQGFKVEFVNPVKSITQNSKISMVIPLATFHILSPNSLQLTAVIKWFEPNGYRTGGVFVEPSREDAYILEKIIHKVSERRQV